MAHITFAEYAAFGYSKVPQEQFPRFSLLATKEIDYRTFNRIQDITDDIRLTACEVVDILFTGENDDRLTSVNTGGYSESFAAPVPAGEQITAVILKYLPQELTSWVVDQCDRRTSRTP